MSTGLSQWLTELAARGVEIWCEEDGILRYRMPADLFVEGIAAQLSRRKAELARYFRPLPDRIGPFLPAPAQIAMYLQDCFAQDSFGHVLRYPVRVRADVDLDALSRAINELAVRHPMLCALIKRIEGQPLLFFSARPQIELEIDRIDVHNLKGTQCWIESRSTMRLELDRGPLCRFHLALPLSGESAGSVLLLVAHHCVVDHMSMEAIWRDLDLLYAKEIGEPDTAPGLPALGLSDMCNLPHWQAARPAANLQREFWREKLRRLPAPLRDAREHAEARSTGAGLEFRRPVDRATMEGLRRVARDASVTEFVVMFTVAALLFLRRTATGDLCLGVATSGRNGHPVRDLVGCYVNTVPVVAERTLLDVSPAEAVRRMAGPLREAVFSDLVPFVELVRLVPIERVPGRPAIFSTLFTWLDTCRWESGPTPSHGLGISALHLPGPNKIGVTHDLVLSVHQLSERCYLNWGFDTGVHDADVVRNLADEFEHMLGELTSHSGTKTRVAADSTRERFEL